MELKKLLKAQAAGANGGAKTKNAVFVVAVDNYMRENLIYLYHYTKGMLDYRTYEELSSDDIFFILLYFKYLCNASCIYRLFSHMMEVDTWEVKRGSDV